MSGLKISSFNGIPIQISSALTLQECDNRVYLIDSRSLSDYEINPIRESFLFNESDSDEMRSLWCSDEYESSVRWEELQKNLFLPKMQK